MMQKIWKSTLILLIIICLSGGLCVNASDSLKSGDSRATENAIKNKIQSQNEDYVITVYQGIFMSEFARGDSIEEIISDENNLPNGYLVKKRTEQNKEEFALYELKNGQTQSRSFYKKGYEAFYNYSIEPEKIVKDKGNIKEVYCLNGESSHDGIYIYYVTDNGDYIYYKEYAKADKEYLIPEKEFRTMAKTISDKRKEMNENLAVGGPIMLEDIYDVSVYEIKTDNMFKTFLIPMTVFLSVVLIVAIMFLIKRKAM